MGEADSALRDEIEKVRERARLQALAQGLGPDAAVIQGNTAVEEFCSRWGIRPEMVAPGVLRGPRATPSTPQPFRDEQRKVDLGASPLRASAGPGQTQAIRIADLLKRTKDAEIPAVRTGTAGPVSGSVPPPAATVTRSGTNLSSLLQRMRAAEPRAAVPAQAPAPAPAPVPSAPAPRPVPAAASAPRSVTLGEGLAGGGTLTANAERRRQVLEEFDRTYAEVQTMLEQRIGVVDIALNEASLGIDGVLAKAKAGGLQPQEMETLATDVDRLRQQLTVMMSLCDDFLRHMNDINSGRQGGR